MRLLVLLFLPVAGIFGQAFQVRQRRAERNPFLEYRAITYAQTCTYFGTTSGSFCNSPTVSGPYVSVTCLGAASQFAICGASTTASTCFLTTSTQFVTVLGFGGLTTITSFLATTACTTLTFAPAPVAATTTATATSTSRSTSASSSSTSSPRSTTASTSSSTNVASSTSSTASTSRSTSASSTSSTNASSSGSSSVSSSTRSSQTSTTAPTTTTRASTSVTSSISTSTTLTTSRPAQVDSTCFADNINGQGRTLPGASTRSDSMTNELCQSFCNNLGFAYSGTEFASECYCGNSAPVVGSSACTLTCSAAGSTDLCGGPNALNVRYNSTVAASAAQASAVAASYTSQGCYSDHYPTRVLSGASTTAASMTVESCLNFCSAAGFSLGGLENGSECYCGNSILTDGTSYGIGGQAGCTYACAGNSAELCGGNNVLNLYNRGSTVSTAAIPTPTTGPGAPFTPLPTAASGYTYLGCYLDGSARTLTTQLSDVTSVEACITACSNSGYRYAGLEYFSQCFCGSQIINNGPTVINALNCNYQCSGNSNETCGGSNAIQVYVGTPAIPPIPPPSIPSGILGFTYVDTFKDDAGNRILAIVRPISSNTVENCITSCASAGYSYAGVEYGAECYCGATILDNRVGAQLPTMTCQGNSSEYCGGPNLIQVYTGTPPPPQYLSTPFTNGLCVTDNVNNTRTLAGASFPGRNVTTQACKLSCQAFTYYGVEYSTECYCGNSFPSQIPYSTGCTMACGGDSAQICGGPNALNIYNS